MTQRASSTVRRDRRPVFQSFEEAISCHQQGQLSQAEQLYEIVLEADDRHFGAVHGLGLVQLQQGRFEDAMAMFRRATKIDRSSAEAQHHLGVALTGLGRPAEAIERFEKALAIRSDFAEAHDSRGHALQLLGRTAEAIAHHEKALAIKPSYAEAYNNLGNALHRLGRSEKAIPRYEKALAIRPDYAEVSNNLGNALLALGRHEEAIVRFEKAIVIRPDYVHAHINLGNALGALGLREEAMARYDLAVAIAPNNVEALLKRGYMLAALQCHDEAIIEYDKALAIKPNDTEALTARGNALIRLGLHAEAAEIFNNLAKRGLRSIEVLLALTSVPASMVSTDLLAQLAQVIRPEGRDKTEFESVAAFVRASVLDRAGRHAEAWEHLLPANRALFLATQRELGETIARQRAALDRLREGPSKAEAAGGDGTQTISLFILGPSRSGKTTMERLMSTLPGVKRGYENRIVEDAVRRALQTASLPAGTSFESLPPRLYSLCREVYFDELSKRAASAAVFTNTNPEHIHEADLVASSFPNVRFIFMKRNTEDNVLRIYQRKYTKGNVYAYDLKAARDHVLWYDQMMALLSKKFPEIVRVIQYEDMVGDPAAALRTSADLCSLPMTDRPLPAVGDDRECAAPYLRLMAAELES